VSTSIPTTAQIRRAAILCVKARQEDMIAEFIKHWQHPSNRGWVLEVVKMDAKK
jgi:hypothetical protein